jgi:beta-lactamase class A
MRALGDSSRFVRGWAICVVVGASCALTWAGPPPELRDAREEMNELLPGSVRVKIPNTTAGKQLQWVLDALNNVDVSEAKERCSDSFLEFISQQELEDTFREIKEEVYEGKEIVAVRAAAGDRDDSIDAVITGMAMPNALSLLLMTDDKTGKIAILRFAPAGGNNAGSGGGGAWDPLAQDAQKLGGVVSFGVYEVMPRDASVPNVPLELLPISGQDEHRPLNIANTMRLYVLNTLVERVGAGAMTWDTRVTIADTLKSLPSGRMQLETAGRGYPIRRFAELMMTTDDNTAIDHVIHAISREAVEASVNAMNDNAALNVPFLMTREAFALKLAVDDKAAVYVDASDEDQRAMLVSDGRVARATTDVAMLGTWTKSPRVGEIGWFASAEQLCELMKRMRELETRDETMLISPWIRATTGIGLDPQVWKAAAYVGASEPGAMSGVWLLERHDAKTYVFSVIWNSAEVERDQEGFNALAERAVEILGADFQPADEEGASDEETVSPIRRGAAKDAEKPAEPE